MTHGTAFVLSGTGTQEIMCQAREKLTCSNGLQLLLDMLNFDPSQRPTMLEALRSDFFRDFREEPAMSCCEHTIADHEFLSFYSA